MGRWSRTRSGSSRYDFDQAQSRTYFPDPITVDQWQTLSKITAQAGAQDRFEASYSRRERDFLPFNAGFSTATNPASWIGIGWLNSVANFGWNRGFGRDVSPRRAGRVHALHAPCPTTPSSQQGVPGVQDVFTGIVVQWDAEQSGEEPARPLRVQDGGRPRIVSDLWRGSHNFKAGFNWSGTEGQHPVRGPVGYPRYALSGLQWRTVPGAALEYAADPTDGHATSCGLSRGRVVDRVSSHGDAWPSGSKMGTGSFPSTIFSAGRGRRRGSFPRENDVFDPTAVAPRFGLVWDLTGDHRTTVSLSPGRFYYGAHRAGTLFRDADGRRIQRYDWTDRNGDGLYQVGEEGILRSDTAGTLPDASTPISTCCTRTWLPRGFIASCSATSPSR